MSWNYKPGRSPKLAVWDGDFEVSAPQGMLLESRHFIIRSKDAVMWLGRVGWAGTLVNRKDCIRVAASDKRGRRIEFALSPEEGLQRAWQALADSGVTPRAEGNAGPAATRSAS